MKSSVAYPSTVWAEDANFYVKYTAKKSTQKYLKEGCNFQIKFFAYGRISAFPICYISLPRSNLAANKTTLRNLFGARF